MVAKYPEHPMSDKAVDALKHASEWGRFHADLRARHFNFFVVFVAASIGAVTQLPNISVSLCVIGFLVGVVFLVLDCRYDRLILDARAEFYRLEPLIGSELHRYDQRPDAKREVPRSRYISTTKAYRLMYGGVAIAAVFYLALRYYNLLPPVPIPTKP